MADRNSIERETSAAGNVAACHPHVQQHWQDFDNPVTISAPQAGDMYRAVYSVRATLRLVADHQLRLNSHGEQEPPFSSTEIEAMLSGALALIDGMGNAFEDSLSTSVQISAKVSGEISPPCVFGDQPIRIGGPPWVGVRDDGAVL